ncbi:MAG: class I SAM-dependent methyltransferase [Defluviitaleaceae bacterium]|nr:class I SAM-dependent methyltransferase [Defluviitaleaceae bacterium]
MIDYKTDVAGIMSIDEDIVWILPKVKYPNNMITGTCSLFYEALGKLDLTPEKTILDIPCGMGGVSVYLAKEYGSTIYGYDVMPGFIDKANEYATKHGVRYLCHYAVGDIREVVLAGVTYDALIWSSPPHLWDNYDETIKHLRACVKDKGFIFINDAWVNDVKNKDIYPNFGTRAEMLKAVVAYGDEVVYYTEEVGEDIYDEGFAYERKAVITAIEDAGDPMEKAALMKLLKSIDKANKMDADFMGGCYMVLRINRKDNS